MTDAAVRAPMPDHDTRRRIREAIDADVRSRDRLGETDTTGRNLGHALLERRYSLLDARIEEECRS